MRLQGKITRWDDERGFGFISWHGDGSTVFVHIKSFTGKSRRPEVGDIVTYETGKGKEGRPRAINVRFSDEPEPAKVAVHKKPGGGLPVAFTCGFLAALCFCAYFGRISWLVVMVYVVASIVTFGVYAWDKSSARLGRWRTQEATLHLMDVMCGWPGGLAAQRLLRHKSSKQAFLSVFWFTVFLNVVAVSYLVWRGDSAAINHLFETLWQSAVQQLGKGGV